MRGAATMYAYIEEFAGNLYAAKIEQDTDYRPVGVPADLNDPSRAMRVVGKRTRLSSLSWQDEPIGTIRKRNTVGVITKMTESHICVEITEDEYRALIAADEAAWRAKRDKKRQGEIAGIKEMIAKAEAQESIPTPAEAVKMRRKYNNLYNEGGYGYVPQIIDSVKYVELKDRLAALEK
ncbi:hypothetical protein WMO26_13230 [Solibaculum sp. CLA-JM-H44]|uniref:Uncharacterized protein n=2 Tax=Solibaculum intestinale TaxID=3133165 RepID=A0ABV1E4Z9_9FIRM